MYLLADYLILSIVRGIPVLVYLVCLFVSSVVSQFRRIAIHRHRLRPRHGRFVVFVYYMGLLPGVPYRVEPQISLCVSSSGSGYLTRMLDLQPVLVSLVDQPVILTIFLEVFPGDCKVPI